MPPWGRGRQNGTKVIGKLQETTSLGFIVKLNSEAQYPTVMCLLEVM